MRVFSLSKVSRPSTEELVVFPQIRVRKRLPNMGNRDLFTIGYPETKNLSLQVLCVCNSLSDKLISMKVPQTLITLSLLLGAAASLSAASIGFSFNSNRDNASAVMTSTTVAGVVPSTGWVNTDGGGDAVAGATGTFENNGVTVDWSSNGTWNTNNGSSNGDNILMNGYVDAINAGGAAQINLTGLSALFADGYDVYVYFGSDGNGRTGAVAGPGATFDFSTFSAQAGASPFPFVQTTSTDGSNPDANYALFSGLTGDSQTFDLIRGSSNSGFHGVQIVGDLIPEPSSCLLIGVGGLLMMRRRRK